MPSLWSAFDRIRALTRQHSIFPSERIYQDQSDLQRIIAGDGTFDNNAQASILDQTSIQINRLERYRDYDQMDQMGEISLALDLYCLAAGTKIPLLDGTCPTISELVGSGRREFWLYGFDFKTGLPKPVLGRCPHVSGTNAELVRVQWDGGHIDCTASHKFHTKRGWVAAGELVAGDSLTPINIIRHNVPPVGTNHRVAAAIRKGYEAVQCGTEWVSTHHWVHNHFNGKLDKGLVIHHKDIRRKNNDPDNLESMAWLDHRKLHEKIGRLPPEIEQQRRESVSKSIKTKWADPVYRAKMIPHCRNRGKQLLSSGSAYRGGSKPTTDWAGVCELARSLGVSLTHAGLAKAAKISRATLDRMLVRASITWPQFKSDLLGVGFDNSSGSAKETIFKLAADMVNNGLNPKDWDTNRHKVAARPATVATVEKYFGSVENLANAVGYNHTVTAVTGLPGTAAAVYDLYVDDGHAFAAGTDTSWVLVHNSDEASLVDPELKHVLVIRAKSRRLKNELEDLFNNVIRWDTNCRPAIRYLCKYGEMPFEILLNRHRSGVSALKFVNVYNFTRVETKQGDLIGFFYHDLNNPQPVFMHPWQIVHMRLTSFENAFNPYGRSVLEGGRKAYKQLRLMEDGALIYRLTRASEKRKFTIPVGLIAPKEVPEYLQMIARNFKRARFYNPSSGTFDERYSPLVQEDDIFLPRRPDGSGPEVDVLAGAANLDQMADIEYFKKKMVAPLKIPFARVGIGDGAGEASEKSLSQAHSEFAKAVQWVQREVATGLTKVALVHLALRGFRVDDLKGFDIALTATSAMEELYRIETWQTRVSVMADLKDLGWFPKEWIVTHFTDLSPDEIEELKEMEQVDSNGGPGGGSPGGLDVDLGGDGEEPLPGMDMPPPDGSDGGGTLEVPPLDETTNPDQRLLKEHRDIDKKLAFDKIVAKWAARRGKSIPSEMSINSGFDHVLENKELDGLTTSAPSSDANVARTFLESIHDPNDDKGLLVEWSVDKDIRNSVIAETLQILTCDDEATEYEDEDEITPSDLP